MTFDLGDLTSALDELLHVGVGDGDENLALSHGLVCVFIREFIYLKEVFLIDLASVLRVVGHVHG